MPIVSEGKDPELKLTILYLINRMELSMSRAQITEFLLGQDIMSYFDIEQTLSQLTEQNMLAATYENAQDASTTRYTATNEGLTNLELLQGHLPRNLRLIINQFVEENRGKVRRDFEVTAAYFPIVETHEYQVKCGAYEDKRALMEITVSVETRDQAKLLQSNWRANASRLYQRILAELVEVKE